jgi:GT2 family glycosyltransferase
VVPLVSVVVSTYDRPERLARLLNALRAQTLGPERFEVIVVDNGSQPETGRALAAQVAQGGLALRTCRLAVTRGPAGGRNAGWRRAAAPLVAFTDDDCRPAPDWLQAALVVAGRHPGAIVQGVTVPDPDEADRSGVFSHTVRIERLGPQYETCNILYPRALLDALGGFDESFGLRPAGEDTDLAWRAIESGAPTAYAPLAQVFHAVSEIGPLGRLRVANRWNRALQVYQRHPGAREGVFTKRIFWKPWHYTLLRAALALALPHRLRHLRVFLIGPYVESLLLRCEYEHGRAWHAPFYFVEDLVEINAALRASLRYRMLIV